MAHVVKTMEDAWETWSIRFCILASLLIQVLLTFLAPWRKSHRKLGFFIWLLYLSADAVAIYVIGLITHNPGKENPTETADILVFWAPFLLVHLGGPDTITALALEDNELWLRHFLQLATQGVGTIYLFYKSFHVNKNKLWFPFMIMFVDGCVKYLERTFSLYQASMDCFRDSLQRAPDPGPNYATLMEEYASMKDAKIPVNIISNLRKTSSYSVLDDDEGGGTIIQDDDTTTSAIDVHDTNNEIDLVKKAHHFYKRFRGLIAEVMMTFEERSASRKFFLADNTTASNAFKVIQIELNFIYDIFFTKINILRQGRYATRAFSFSALIACLLIFSFKDKRNYHKEDVYITYVLLGGAIFMDVIGYIMLCFSDWAVVGSEDSKCRGTPLKNILGWWLKHQPRRWSEKMSQYDLLYYCLNDHRKLFKALMAKRVRDVFTDILHICRMDFEIELQDLIFEVVKKKAKESEDEEKAKKASNARGNLVFVDQALANFSKDLEPWTMEVDYDQSLLLWHIATSLCTSKETSNSSQTSLSKDALKYREYSEMLSDYMMYLLITQPSMTSAVAGIAQVRFQDTCAEAKQFIRRKLPQDQHGNLKKLMLFFVWLPGAVTNFIISCCCFCWSCCCCNGKPKTDWKRSDTRFEDLCNKIMEVRTDWKPIEVKGDSSKSVLFDACRLAKKLDKLGAKQWEVTFTVWVELLCYAASRCNPRSHVQQLRRGSELLTMVWLLMAQVGFGEHFRIKTGTGWAKLLVEHDLEY